MAYRVSIVLFDDFTLLDVFGPLDLLGRVPEHFEIELIAREAGPVKSGQGAQLIATSSLADASTPDIVMVPGGLGTRSLVAESSFITWLAEWASSAKLVTSVCTGSALLAAAGLLDGYRATSNKRSFKWVVSQGPSVDWVSHARWVHDRDRWTSSGVAAGMDMTAALIADLCGQAVADSAARDMELELHRYPDWDPFAEMYGLG